MADSRCPYRDQFDTGSATNGHHNPLLHHLSEHGHMGSTSGGSTSGGSTSTTATAQAIARHCNGSIEFDERDIYFVSPSKRKGSMGGGSSPAPAASTIRSSLRHNFSSNGNGGDLQQDLSFDNCEIASHFSDTAMQSLAMGASMAARQHNNVTFANYVSEQRICSPTSTLASAASVGSVASRHRGSLRRAKGRSNQSLCSCDAGADTELNPDRTRPLFEYGLERGTRAPRGHTYTCEQNAQILMRLERERNRKLSLGSAGGPPGPPDTSTGTGNAIDDGAQSDAQSSSDAETIPPVPPPPSLKRNASLRSLRRFPLQPPALCNGGGNGTASGNGSGAGSHNPITNLCSGEMLLDCTGGGLDAGSIIDDCATSILKCADLGNGSGGNNNKTNVATLASMVANAKPDVCRVGNGHATTSFTSYPPPSHQDDIFMPHSAKPDPALCFLHTATPAHAADPASRSATAHQHKFNTIGPGNECARQLSAYAPQTRIADRCGCVSQSVASFTRDYFGERQRMARSTRPHHPAAAKQSSFIFHTGSGERGWLDEDMLLPMPPPLQLSRSYSNLVDADVGVGMGMSVGVDLDGRTKRLPYHQHYPANAATFSSSCSFGTAAGLLNNASFTTLSSSTSGLKESGGTQHVHPLTHVAAATAAAAHHPHRTQGGHPGHKHHQLHSSVSSIMPWKHRQCPSRGSSSSGTNSFRFDAAKHWLAISSILLIIGAASVAVPLALRVAASAPFEERLRVAVHLLDQVPLIDGHNDLPWNIRKFLHNKLNDFNFDEDLRNVMPWARSHWSHTDLQRLKKGRVSAQFWAAYVPCEAQHRDAVQLTLEQIDVIKRLTDRYSPQLTTCTSAADIIEAHKNHQLCSLTGVEGGHSLGGSLAVLRTLYAIGVRYMTLTSTCHTPWADSSYADAPTFNVKHGGLTIFGKTIIREMNRLGMMVDLSHVSTGTMRDALEVSEAPVIFSHSSAYELCNSSRNVQDDMLQSLAKNGGLVMVNFYSKFLSCSENSTVHDAVAHINHIKRVAGIDHVGLGAGYDGINFTPKGLEDVSSYPTLFAELLGEGWSIDDLTKLAGGNFLRVMQQVERIRDEKKAAGAKPYEDHPNFRSDDPYNCTSS